MFECENCEREFEEPEVIDGEKRCPYCKSGDIVGGENARVNSKGLIDADSMPKIIISEKEI